MGGIPARGRDLELDDAYGPFLPRPFCEIVQVIWMLASSEIFISGKFRCIKPKLIYKQIVYLRCFLSVCFSVSRRMEIVGDVLDLLKLKLDITYKHFILFY